MAAPDARISLLTVITAIAVANAAQAEPRASAVAIRESNYLRVARSLNLPVLPAANGVGSLRSDADPDRHRCTAFYLGDGLVATASHCLDYGSGNLAELCATISVRWWRPGGTARASRCERVQYASPAFQNRSRDVAYFRVSDPPPKSDCLPVAGDQVLEGDALWTLGFPQGGALTVRTCRAEPSDGPTFYASCRPQGGESGGPVFGKRDDGSWYVVGLVFAQRSAEDPELWATDASTLPRTRCRQRLHLEPPEVTEQFGDADGQTAYF